MMNAVEVIDLRRIFKSTSGVIKRTTKEIVAVDGISFDVHEGELYGLLGPNGAGKTTTVKMLTTLLIPTAGRPRSKGFDVVRKRTVCARESDLCSAASAASIGACPEWIICAILPVCIMWIRMLLANALMNCWIWLA